MIEPSSQPDRAPTKTRLRILQTIAWINVGYGVLITLGGLFGAYVQFTSPDENSPPYSAYLGYFFLFALLCIGIAFLLTGRGFLKKNSQGAAEVSASGFALFLWFTTGSFFKGVLPVQNGGPLPGAIVGILFAYACFLAIKRLVIKPHFAGTVE